MYNSTTVSVCCMIFNRQQYCLHFFLFAEEEGNLHKAFIHWRNCPRSTGANQRAIFFAYSRPNKPDKADIVWSGGEDVLGLIHQSVKDSMRVHCYRFHYTHRLLLPKNFLKYILTQHLAVLWNQQYVITLGGNQFLYVSSRYNGFQFN